MKNLLKRLLSSITGASETAPAAPVKAEISLDIGTQEKHSEFDYNIVFENSVVNGIPVELLEIGDLNVPSGKIVVCDPLVTPDMPPLSLTVSPGKYPVKIYVAKTQQS